MQYLLALIWTTKFTSQLPLYLLNFLIWNRHFTSPCELYYSYLLSKLKVSKYIFIPKVSMWSISIFRKTLIYIFLSNPITFQDIGYNFMVDFNNSSHKKSFISSFIYHSKALKMFKEFCKSCILKLV